MSAGIIGGALLQGLGQGIATAGAFGMRWETLMAELDERRKQRLEELRETAKLSQETHQANLRADEAMVEERIGKNLAATDPELAKRRRGVLAGEMETVETEKAGGFGAKQVPMSLTAEQQSKVARAGMTPAQQAEYDLRQQQVGISEEQLKLQTKTLEATLAHQKEQLKVSWASLDKQMKMAEAQLKRAESAEWASLFKGEMDGYRERLAPLQAEFKSLQTSIDKINALGMTATPEQKQDLKDLQARADTLRLQIEPITTSIATLQLEAAARRRGKGGFDPKDPFGVLGSSADRQSSASAAARK